MEPTQEGALEFEDFLPSMAERLGPAGLIDELCKGFRLLVDAERGVITLESLKQNSAGMLGLAELGEEEAVEMLREGDLDGDGTLDQMEFCILMFRMSPELMEGSTWMLEELMGKEMVGLMLDLTTKKM
ncbi:calcium-binding protein PBP1-like [Phalaenopsis equestris]|uniref:calcium-binding protein PBP1-like n=1 Tax=Phalaenopsis equestris TaxID=78828 RepID=UPI0009E35EB0|nr:calcium-binding protein PBP1-like [Phalaenopsis equestris]